MPLARRYATEGFWTDASLGAMVADGLAGMGGEVFEVHSRIRPWKGTFADVDRAARALASSLRARGVGPGSVVVIQLPNWLEAGVAFWAAAYLGAVVVPIVHFYGAKEVEYILRVTAPDVVVTAEQFGHSDYLATYTELLARRAGAACGWWSGRPHPGDLPAGATSFASLLDAEPIVGPVDVDPEPPTIIAFTSGTTRDPKGVVHSHRTIGCETRQLDAMFPRGWPTPDHRSTGGPLHRHAQRLPRAVASGAPGPPGRRLGPG